MGSPTMAPLTVTLSLLSLLSASAHPGGYWWMGKEGAFLGQNNNNQVTDEISGYNEPPSQSPGDNKSPPLDITAGYEAAGGSYGSQPSPSPSVEQSSPPVLAVTAAESGELPVTECPVGWKCVAEFFCDVTATMVPQRVQLSKAQVAIRGDLIQCMNQATGQFNVCCRKPQEPSPSSSQLELRPEVSPEVSPEVRPEERPDPERIQFEEVEEPSSCPVVSVLPPIQLCANRKSTCWSAGLPDVDCQDNALCCFDGCANVCLGRVPVAGNPGPQNSPRQTAATTSVKSPGQNILQNLPSNTVTNPSPSPVLSQQKIPSNTVSNSPPPVSQQASAQPFITCPSAMKCVPRVNCDFNGVMVNRNVVLSPLQEVQRVPLIPCINSARGNSVDVCCRDPNYKDPWPEMGAKKTKKRTQPNISINQRVSTPDQALTNRAPVKPPRAGPSYGR